MNKTDSASARVSGLLPYVLLAAIILLFGAIRLRLLSFPLERDEGEYAYAGQLLLKSLSPYQFCHTMKLPGTAAAYALIMAVFGQTKEAIHFGLLLVNAATIALMFALAKRLFGSLAAVITSAAYALLSIGPSVFGFAGHATQFVLLPAIAGIVLLLMALDSKKPPLLFASGLLLGLAFLMKQPGIFFGFFAFICLLHHLWHEGRRRAMASAGIFLLGAALPFLFTCFFLYVKGDFEPFLFWVFAYAGTYATSVSLSEGVQVFWSAIQKVISPACFIWLFALIGLGTVLWDKRLRKERLFVCGFLLFSFTAVCPGFYFRPHYFVLLLPAIALLCGVAVTSLTAILSKNRLWRAFPVAFFGIAFAYSLVAEKEFFFATEPLVLSRQTYGANPFVEAITIGNYIKTHSNAEDRIAVIGSEPEILFYARRLSGTGYIYMYPLMERQPFVSSMQKDMIAEIETSRPKFMVFVSAGTSWLMRPGSDTTLVDWAMHYAHGNYRKVGVSELTQTGLQYHWQDAENYEPQSPFAVLIFERR